MIIKENMFCIFKNMFFWENAATISESIGVVVNIILTIVIIFITVSTSRNQTHLQQEISEKDFKTRDLERKISLFNKRYEVYFCFKKYYELLDTFFIKMPEKLTFKPSSESPPISLPSTKRDLLVGTLFSNIPGRAEMVDKINDLLEKMKKTSNAAKHMETKKQVGVLNGKLFMLQLEFLKKEESKIFLSKFCYPDYISSSLVNMVKEISAYIVPFASEDEQKRSYESIVREYNYIKKEKIIEKMEELLNLSTKEISPTKNS